jgi:hypothetical protein
MKAKKQTLIFIWLIIGLALSLLAFRQFVLPLMRAQTPAVPGLNPPYLRLAESSQTTSSSQKVVEVRANTAGQETVEVDVVILFDSQVLTIKEEGVRLADQYKVFQINQLEKGRIDFSLFSNPQRGEPTLKTGLNEEALVATLVFDILDQQADSTQLNLEFEPGATDESNLIPIFETRPATPIDILQSIQGILLSL